MSLINRFSISEQGAIIFTGNTLGLGNTNLDIGAFVTLDLTSQVTGFPAGTTLNWKNNQSAAQLTIPATATVLYAELEWGGSYTGSTLPISDLDTPITFNTPVGTYTISPDSATSQEGTLFYSRSQDVTSIIQSDGSGTYSVAGVPAVIGPFQDAAGWTLGIIYKDISLPFRNMSIFSGIEEISAAATQPLDFELSGFLSPAVGTVSGRVLISAMEGDYSIAGDTVSFGPNTGSLIALSGPNNLVNNFFRSQINNGDSESPTVGQLDTTGTFGSINVPTSNPARYGWDITNVATTNFVNNQTSAITRLRTTGDGYAVPLMGIQLDTLPLDFGDAPNNNPTTQGPSNYRTLQESNGPVHIIGTSQGVNPVLTLGRQVTADANGKENLPANGDDIFRNIQDDGTTLPLVQMAPNAASYSMNVTVNNNTGSPANIYAWLDFNQDGIFQTNEGVTAVAAPGLQVVPLTFTRPVGAPDTIYQTYIRVRVTTDNLINTGTAPTAEDTRSYGVANNGEVEDYLLPIVKSPFSCSYFGYRLSVPSGATNSQLTQVNLVTGENTIIKSDIGISIDAVGYNTLDNFLYGIQNGTTNLILIDVNGNTVNFGSIPNLPISSSGNYNVGAIDNNGHLYIKNTSDNVYYVVDVNQASPTFRQLVDPTAGFVLDTAPYGTATSGSMAVADWTFNSTNSILYGIENSTGQVLMMNPLTGVVTTLNTTGVPIGANYGSVYSVSDGFIYATNNNTGQTFRISINPPNAVGELFSQDVPSVTNDGASCLNGILRLDFGDAPDLGSGNSAGNYSTLLANNGPRHQIINQLFLGTQVTAESDARQNSNATGDDIPANIQDDGITTLPIVVDIYQPTYTQTLTVTNNTGQTANVYGWIDFNNDGIFQTQEAAVATVPSAAGTQTVNLVFNTPTNAVEATSFARFRITTDTLVNTGTLPTNEDTRSLGAASDGEVEDYQLTLVNISADISVVKTANPSPVVAGEVLTYTMVVANAGPADALNVTLNDTTPVCLLNPEFSLDGGTTWNSWTGSTNLGTIATGGSKTVLIRGTVNSSCTGNIVNTATVSSTTPDPNLNNNTSTVTVPINTLADVSVVKTANPSPVVAGNVLTYTMLVANAGPSDALSVVLNDTTPACLLTPEYSVDSGTTWSAWTGSLNLGTLIPAASRTILLRGTVNPSCTGNIVNTATVSSTTPDPNQNNNTSTVTVPINTSADVSIVKTANPVYLDRGNTVVFTLAINNAGPSDALNVILADSIPPEILNPEFSVNNGLSWNSWSTSYNIGTLAAGGIITVLIRGKISNTAKGKIDNTATVSSTTPDPNLSNNTSTASININYADLVAPGNFVKAVDKAIADVGDLLTYTISVKNTGNTIANNVVITDPIPNGTSYVAGSLTGSVPISGTPAGGVSITNGIAPGQTILISYKVKVDTIPVPNPIPNTASVAYTYTVDPSKPNGATGSGNTNTVTTQVNHGEIPGPGTGPDGAKKTADKATTTPGDTVTYTVTFKNTGNVNVNNVVVKDVVPAGTSFISGTVIIDGISKPAESPVTGINVGTVAPNQTVSVTFKVTVLSTAVSPLINKATIDYNYIVDPTKPPVDKTTGTNTVNVNVVKPSISIVKSPNRVGAVVGDLIRYSIVVTNNGEVQLDNVIVSDPLTSELSYADNLTVNNVSTPGNIIAGVNIGSLSVGQSKTVAFDAKVISLPADGFINNISKANYTYTVSGNTFNGSGSSNEVKVRIYNPKLDVIKSSDKNIVKVGDTFKYTISIKNSGDIAINNVIAQDTIPQEFKILGTKVDGISVNGDINTGINIGTIAIGQTKVVELTLQVLSDRSEIFYNVAVAKGTITTDPKFPPSEVKGTGTDTKGVNVYNPELTVTKSVDKPYVIVGDTVTYTIVAKNTGDIPLGNIELAPVFIYDILSSELQFVDGSLTINGLSDSLANILQGITVGALNVGQSVTITFKAKVLSNKISPIENTAIATFGFILPGTTTPQTGNSTSNIVNVIPEVANIDIVKTADNSFVVLGDNINYTVKLTNTGTVEAKDVIFKDALPSGVQLIDGSFKINGVPVYSVNLVAGINIGNIAKGQTVILQYTVKVVTPNCSLKIINSASVKFNYVLPDGTAGIVESVASSTTSTTTNMGITNFRQISIEEYLNIPIKKPDMEAINHVDGNIKVNKCHVIETPITKSEEGQNLTGYKLVIFGTLEETIEYTACDEEQSVHSAHYNIPFSTFIVLPGNYVLGSKIEVDGIVEDIYTNMKHCRTFFSNVTVLINAKIRNC